jgi:hypothetical protein
MPYSKSLGTMPNKTKQSPVPVWSLWWIFSWAHVYHVCSSINAHSPLGPKLDVRLSSPSNGYSPESTIPSLFRVHSWTLSASPSVVCHWALLKESEWRGADHFQVWPMRTSQHVLLVPSVFWLTWKGLTWTVTSLKATRLKWQSVLHQGPWMMRLSTH